MHLNIILPSTSGSPQLATFPQVSPPTPCAHLSPPPYAPHAPPISFISIVPPAQYRVRNTYHSVPRYVASSIPCHLVPLRPKYSPQHRILKHPHPMLVTKFHTHTKQQAKL
jgi:hypothetical protein